MKSIHYKNLIIFIIFLFLIIFISYHLFLYYYKPTENFELVDSYTNSNNTTILSVDQIQLTNNLNNPDFSNFKKIKELDKSINYLLVVDMPNTGGGTTYFINLIVSMFKDRIFFLIVRNFNGNVHFYINDEVKLDVIMSDNDSILFLNENKNNINKIFVNHTSGHSVSFLNNLFTMGKKVTTITHDYSLLFNNPQLYYRDIKNPKTERSAVDIKKYSEIIIQNIVTLHIYKTYLSDQTIYVSPLPDYQNRLEEVSSRNNTTVIGIIGTITEIKGAKYVQELIQWSLKNSNKYTIIIFGSIDMKYDKQFSYKNVNELNQLLTNYKPNILLEFSIWPETYSYTLTLGMIIGLPILYLKKPFPSVIENRLSTYNKAFKYDKIEDMYKDFELKKQNYLYTIEPNIYFNTFWEDYFQ